MFRLVTAFVLCLAAITLGVFVGNTVFCAVITPIKELRSNRYRAAMERLEDQKYQLRMKQDKPFDEWDSDTKKRWHELCSGINKIKREWEGTNDRN